MILDPQGFAPNEPLSNHAVQAFVHKDCPLSPRMCFGIATGFGGVPINICEYFKDESTAKLPKAECTYSVDGP